MRPIMYQQTKGTSGLLKIQKQLHQDAQHHVSSAIGKLTTCGFMVRPAIRVGSYADPGASMGYMTSQMRGPCVASVTYWDGRSLTAGLAVQLDTPSPVYPSQHWH
jgi:hypothetical protein